MNTEDKYRDRVNELVSFTELEYGVESTDMRILVSCLLPTAGCHPCWLIVDAHHHDFWDDLDFAMQKVSQIAIRSAQDLRGIRPRYANRMIEPILNTPNQPNIVVDRLFHAKLPPVNTRSLWPELESQCLRLRMHLNWKKIPRFGMKDELLRRLRLVVDPEHRPFLPVPLPKPNEMLLHAIDMVKRANAALVNPVMLVKNALILPTSHAVLHGRDRLEPRDHQMLLRVLQNTVKAQTWVLLRRFAEQDGAHTIEDLCLYEELDRSFVVRECARLAEEGVLNWPSHNGSGKKRKFLWLEPGVGDDMRQFIRGELQWWKSDVN